MLYCRKSGVTTFWRDHLKYDSLTNSLILLSQPLSCVRGGWFQRLDLTVAPTLHTAASVAPDSEHEHAGSYMNSTSDTNVHINIQ